MYCAYLIDNEFCLVARLLFTAIVGQEVGHFLQVDKRDSEILMQFGSIWQLKAYRSEDRFLLVHSMMDFRDMMLYICVQILLRKGPANIYLLVCLIHSQ